MGLTLKVFIAGVDRTNCVAALSAEWEDALDGFGPLRCVMTQSQVVYVPPVGASFKVSDGASPETIYWDGQIFRVVRRWAPNSVDLIEFDVECQPYTHIFARRMIWKDRENKTLYGIVSWINTNLLAGEGISLSGVENPGPTITERLTWFLVPISRAFDDLAAITGRHWRLGPAKVLTFAQLTVTDAPFNITDTVGEWEPGSVEIEEDDAEYANRIHEVSEIAVAGTGGSTGTAQDTEEAITAFAGQLVYETKAIIQEMLEITVNGAVKTFIVVEEGASVPGSGYDFYYIRGGIGFFELDFGPAAGGEVVRFRYRGGWSMYPDSQGAGTDDQNAATPGVRVVTVDNASAQTARAAIDGGSGIYEMREEQRVVTDAATLKSIGQGRLRQYAVAIKKIRLTTYRDDALLKPGQRILVNLSEHSINQQVYIERCRYRWLVDAGGFTLHTSIECTSNEPTGRHAGIMEHTIDAARIGLGGGDAGAGGNSGTKVIQERPKGVVDGSNTAFKLSYYPAPPLVWLKSGGRPMDPFSDYTVSGPDVIYVSGSQPKMGEEHWVWYFHDGVLAVSKARDIGGGTANRIDYGYAAAFAMTGNMSLGMWIKLPSNAVGHLVVYGYPSGGVAAENSLYAMKVTGATGAWDIWYWHDYNAAGQAHDHIFDCNLPNAAWRYIGISRNATAKTVAFYLGNGNTVQLVETWTYPDNPLDGSSPNNKLTFGGGSSGGTDDNLSLIGVVQEHYLWNRILTQAEHESAMKGDFSSTSLLLAVPLLGASPEVDTSGNGRLGAITGTTIVAGH